MNDPILMSHSDFFATGKIQFSPGNWFNHALWKCRIVIKDQLYFITPCYMAGGQNCRFIYLENLKFIFI